MQLNVHTKKSPNQLMCSCLGMCDLCCVVLCVFCSVLCCVMCVLLCCCGRVSHQDQVGWSPAGQSRRIVFVMTTGDYHYALDGTVCVLWCTLVDPLWHQASPSPFTSPLLLLPPSSLPSSLPPSLSYLLPLPLFLPPSFPPSLLPSFLPSSLPLACWPGQPAITHLSTVPIRGLPGQ